MFEFNVYLGFALCLSHEADREQIWAVPNHALKIDLKSLLQLPIFMLRYEYLPHPSSKVSNTSQWLWMGRIRAYHHFSSNSHLSLYCTSASAHMIAMLRLIQKSAFGAGNSKLVADSWVGTDLRRRTTSNCQAMCGQEVYLNVEYKNKKCEQCKNNKQLSICVDKKCMHM